MGAAKAFWSLEQKSRGSVERNNAISWNSSESF